MLEMESDDGYSFKAERKIEDGSSGDKGSNVVKVYSDFPGVDKDEYKVSNEEYSTLLLSLIGIDKVPKIIATQAPTDEEITIRTIFHFFFLSEENIFEKRTPLDNPDHSKITKSLTSLIYLLTADDLNRFLPKSALRSWRRELPGRQGALVT